MYIEIERERERSLYVIVVCYIVQVISYCIMSYIRSAPTCTRPWRLPQSRFTMDYVYIYIYIYVYVLYIFIHICLCTIIWYNLYTNAI